MTTKTESAKFFFLFIEETNMKKYTYFGFRHGKLTTVILSTMDNVEDAIDCNRYVDDPQDAEKQIEEWKNS
jgi:hypothetical protein